MADTTTASKGSQRGPFLHVLLAVLGLAAFAGFVALGVWQMERRVWKLELIDAVNQRATAAAVSAPGMPDWAQVSRDRDEYRHVSASGEFLSEGDIRVATASELGTGYWIMTPLRRADGSLVFINRGFVEQGQAPTPVPAGQVEVAGLLRMGEPGGGVLRDNQPGAGRWYSRDVVAMASQYGLAPVAPYFIDAQANAPGSPGGTGPVGGLTVITFHNNHLVYALTWFALAALVVIAAWIVWREPAGKR
ncbi:SURF1 family protein [Haliea sp. E17]|uniref:SURF1 family protein n=1 Tax=Haliea sp. E17 TaxID=3401576 RepID=UPI003AAE3ADC